MKEYRETIDYMEQEIVRLQDASGTEKDFKAKSKQMQDELERSREQIQQLNSQKERLTLELEQKHH